MNELGFQTRSERHGKPGNIPVNPVVEEPPTRALLLSL